MQVGTVIVTEDKRFPRSFTKAYFSCLRYHLPTKQFVSEITIARLELSLL